MNRRLPGAVDLATGISLSQQWLKERFLTLLPEESCMDSIGVGAVL